MLRRRSIEAHLAELDITGIPRSVVRPAIHTSFSGFLEIDQELASENAEKSRASRSAQDICGEWSDVCDGSIDDLADRTEYDTFEGQKGGYAIDFSHAHKP